MAAATEASLDKSSSETWSILAHSWEFLARLQSDPCFCGAPSVGYKYFPDGEKRPLCGKHMIEILVWDTLNLAGVKKSN